MSKKYQVDLISRKTIEVYAYDARSAVVQAKENNSDYSVDAVYSDDEQIGVTTCDSCGVDILETDEHYTDEHGDLCKKCSCTQPKQ